MNSIGPAVAELERAYPMLAQLFPPEYRLDKRPVIIVQSGGRKATSCLGWHFPNSWKNAQPAALAEITIVAEHLARGPEAIAETLLHEMVHHANHIAGIRDCSKSQYHNRRFRELAETVGLTVEKTNKGWAQTGLGERAKAAVAKLGLNSEAFTLARALLQTRKQPTKMRKYECGCTIARCATDFQATCDLCGEPFAASE